MLLAEIAIDSIAFFLSVQNLHITGMHFSDDESNNGELNSDLEYILYQNTYELTDRASGKITN